MCRDTRLVTQNDSAPTQRFTIDGVLWQIILGIGGGYGVHGFLPWHFLLVMHGHESARLYNRAALKARNLECALDSLHERAAFQPRPMRRCRTNQSTSSGR